MSQDEAFTIQLQKATEGLRQAQKENRIPDKEELELRRALAIFSQIKADKDQYTLPPIESTTL